MISSVIDRFLESGWCSQPDPTGESSMTTANPIARYSAIGRARERVRYAELHHHSGRDLTLSPQPLRNSQPLSQQVRCDPADAYLPELAGIHMILRHDLCAARVGLVKFTCRGRA
jgi:hypothetical protein